MHSTLVAGTTGIVDDAARANPAGSQRR